MLRGEGAGAAPDSTRDVSYVRGCFLRRHPTIGFWLTCLVVACILPASIVATILIVRSYQSERAGRERDTIAMARALMQAVDRELASSVAGLQALAGSRHLEAGDLAGFYAQAVRLHALSGNNVVLLDRDGQQLLNTFKPLGEPLPRQHEQGPILRLFQSDRPLITDLFIGGVLGEPIIAVGITVNLDGESILGLAMGIRPSRLTEILRRQHIPAGQVVSIFDSTGTIVSRSQSADRFVGQKGSPPLVLRMAANAEGAFDGPTLEGIPVMAAFSRSSLSGWSVAIGIPLEQMTANLRQTLWLTATGAALLLLLGAGFANSVRIGRSIRTLMPAAASLGAAANFDIPSSGIAEVNEVGRALVKASRLLTQRAAERDEAELREHRMLVAKQAAEQANHAKSEFLASMSHELRTPLTAISGYAQLLTHNGHALTLERQSRYAENIMQASEQLNKIIGDILELARIEAGHLHLNSEGVDCLEALTEVSETLDILAEQRGILFQVDTSANLPCIQADRGRLIQVLLNLGSNAIKYNVPGGRVRVSAHPRDNIVRFLVEDTGKGIAPGRLSQVFEPFNRLGAEQSQEEGTGIGLAISRRLVLAMNGRIGFDSTLGQGSTFWIELPAAIEPALDRREEAAAVANAGEHRSRVLYIEDKTANIELMRCILDGRSDVQLIEARTVREGIAVARATQPDLVITDIHLPDGKGFDVLRTLRQNPETGHIPVAALTADAMRDNMERMRQAGFDCVLTKPFNVARLMDLIRLAGNATARTDPASGKPRLGVDPAGSRMLEEFTMPRERDQRRQAGGRA